jgi:hypothetical protein
MPVEGIAFPALSLPNGGRVQLHPIVLHGSDAFQDGTRVHQPSHGLLLFCVIFSFYHNQEDINGQ